jgi:DNA relaxase NicK
LFEKFNFNSTFAKGQNETPKSWFYLPVNQHQVSFRQLEYDPSSKSFWEGTTIHFSGINAAQFYKIIQAQKFDWNILKSKNASLGRIDLHYFRKSKITDQSDQLELFMEKCCQRIRDKSKRRKVKWGLESNGLVLRIGNRSSSNYYRVYQKQNGLQFELELKNQLVKSFQKILFDNSIEEFEDSLSKHFY